MSIGGSQCGDAEVMRLRLQSAHAEIELLRTAIRRLAEQDATLSVQGGNVTVTMDEAEPSPASAGSLFMITVPLGDGLVGIKCIEDEDKTPGILMRALTQPCDIGAMSPKGNSEDFGVFVRCPKLESAQVLLKAVQELCATLNAANMSDENERGEGK